jgi:hypothetical protein
MVFCPPLGRTCPFFTNKFRCPRNARFRGAMSSQQRTVGVLLVSRRASFSWWPCPCPCPCPWSSSPRWCATARTEQKTLPLYIRVRPKIYVGHEPRTTVDFPFNRKDFHREGQEVGRKPNGPTLSLFPRNLLIFAPTTLPRGRWCHCARKPMIAGLPKYCCPRCYDGLRKSHTRLRWNARSKTDDAPARGGAGAVGEVGQVKFRRRL